MKIVRCNGGLANQTFQYVFFRFLELESGEPCYLDNSAFCGERVAHNGFEITRVFPNARPRLLSQCFTEDVWQYMVNRGGILQQLRDAGEEFAMVAETGDFQFEGGNVMLVPTNQYFPWIAHTRGKIYYHGYWINRNWLKDRYWEILQNELQFAPLVGDRNKRYEEEIEGTNSVALHIRRGDFLKVGQAVPAENYRQAVDTIRERTDGAHFFVFSDDLPWCRENLEELGLRSAEVTFVEGNTGIDNYIDMQLMSYCRNAALVSISSFSYLAVLLNRNERILVYNATDRQI